jgi:hypothetical protein
VTVQEHQHLEQQQQLQSVTVQKQQHQEQQQQLQSVTVQKEEKQKQQQKQKQQKQQQQQQKQQQQQQQQQQLQLQSVTVQQQLLEPRMSGPEQKTPRPDTIMAIATSLQDVVTRPTSLPTPTIKSPAGDSADDEDDHQDVSFRFSFFDVPTMMSPFPASPAHSSISQSPLRDLPMFSPYASMSTPTRPEDKTDELFAKPMSTPQRGGNVTPFHLPALLSPLPSTPIRPTRGSERSVGNLLDEDLNYTDSEMSDVERTPRPPNRACSALDMPNILSSPKANRHNYSKDLSQILPLVNNDDDKPSEDIIINSDKNKSISSSSSSSPVKIVLKRSRKAENLWNVEEKNQNLLNLPPIDSSTNNDALAGSNAEDVVLPDRPSVSGKQSVKLDKVVLNLKKSVGGNIWNISDNSKKQHQQHDQNHSTSASVGHQTQVVLHPPKKEERRGRKSKSIPMKIQNLEEIPRQNHNKVPATTKSSVIQLSSKPQKDLIIKTSLSFEKPPPPPPPLSSLTKTKALKSPALPATKPTTAKHVTTSREPIAPSLKKPSTPTLTLKSTPALSATKPVAAVPADQKVVQKVAVVKTFVRKTPKVFKVANSLSNRLTLSSGVPGVTVNIMDIRDKNLNSIDLEDTSTTTSGYWKEVAELASKAANAFIGMLYRVSNGLQTWGAVRVGNIRIFFWKSIQYSNII